MALQPEEIKYGSGTSITLTNNDNIKSVHQFMDIRTCRGVDVQYWWIHNGSKLAFLHIQASGESCIANIPINVVENMTPGSPIWMYAELVSTEEKRKKADKK